MKNKDIKTRHTCKSLAAKICAIAAVFGVGFLSGCAKGSTKQTEKISIVCTTFPQYDWVRNIISGSESKFSVALLMSKGTDLHNYQPTAQDMVRIASSDLFIHVGGESDVWVKDCLSEATNKNMIVINLLETLGSGAKFEETIEGMQDKHDHHHHSEDCDDDCAKEHEHEAHHDGENEHEHSHNDEHVWLSLRNAETFVHSIADAVCSLDRADEAAFRANEAAYIAKLKELDSRYAQTVGSAKRRTILFGDRFPFRYLVDDYGLEYFAAFSGCSAESEASFETIAFLAGKVSKLALPVVFTIEKSDQKIARSIIANAGSSAEVAVLDSMQSVTSKDIEAGASYIEIMAKNLEALQKALN
ncbi:MAG: zinc ABC transporter substrate-binding protein [Spirochaetaceae bacterium]|nr:zinc ABC transporter substrate-binding protein [Spirochaetaceae bacterium]